MQKKLRKYLTYIFLAGLCLSMFGYYAYESGKILSFRMAFLERIHFEKTETITLQFSQADRFLRPDIFKIGEFEWHGKMLDVISITLQKDSVLVKCYIDSEETEFKDSHQAFYSKDTTEKSSSSHQKNELVLFILPDCLKANFQHFAVLNKFFSFYTFSELTGFYQVLSPPPIG